MLVTAMCQLIRNVITLGDKTGNVTKVKYVYARNIVFLYL